MRRGLLGLLLLAACQGAPQVPEGGPDAVVLIVIDTIRADHLGCMGYEPATTPNLDDLAARGVLFRRAMTTVPVTFPAVASLLTGRLPRHHGVRDNAGFRLDDDQELLAERFRAAGWKTGAVVASQVLEPGLGLDQGFQEYDATFAPPYPIYNESFGPLAASMETDRRRADAVTDRALEMAAEFGDTPYLLMVHYFDPHAVYDPPPRHAALHPERPYDGEIAYVDEQIGRLLAGLGDRTPLVVVVGDHGEALYEHGEPEHGFLLYEATLHIPLIVAGPGLPVGVAVDHPVSIVDVEPTVARAVGLAPPRTPRDGMALAWSTAPSSRTLYAETFRTLLSYGWSELRAVRRGPLKWIEGPRAELYDLDHDPDELSPLPLERGEELRAALAALADGDAPHDVLRAKSDIEPRRLEALASLGYIDGGGPEPSASEFPHPLDMLPRWREKQRSRGRLRLAQVMVQREDYAGALAQVDTVLLFDPRRADAHHIRGLVRERMGQDPLGDMELALQHDPRYAPALAHVAEAYLRAGRIADAYPLLERQAELRPDLPASHYNLGVAAQRLGYLETARREITRFLELAPDDQRAPSLRALLQRMDQEN